MRRFDSVTLLSYLLSWPRILSEDSTLGAGMRANPLGTCVRIIACLLLGVASAHSQSLFGIRVGDPFTVTERIGFPPSSTDSSGPHPYAEWKLSNDDTLLVVSSVGKIVFIQLRWGETTKGSLTDFSGMYFGKTTLGDIRERLGPEQIICENHQYTGNMKYIIFFSSYIINPISPIVVTFVTKIPWSIIKKKGRSFRGRPDFEHFSTLAVIELGDLEFTSKLWGSYRLVHPGHPPLAVDLLQPPSTRGSGTIIEPSPGTAPGGRADEVRLTDHDGTFLVPVLVNRRLVLDFVLDSGASEVQIPDDVFRTLYRTGTVSDADFLGTETYTLADGSKVPSDRFMLHTLEVGGHTVSNVTASVGTASSEPLLGQSFLSKLGSWTLDNQRHVLVLSDR
jgi:predicted aspartyl protease